MDTKLFEDAILKAFNERGHVNVLIAGRSGVGKSTLINGVFSGNLAETGQGRPVTKSTREITKDGMPITIFDTRGLEMADYKSSIDQLNDFIKTRKQDSDKDRQIHVAWLCIHEDGRRVEDAEIELHEMLSEQMPLVAVITKARSDQGFKAKVQELLPNSRNVARVRAIPEIDDDGHTRETMGLVELIELTQGAIPDAMRNALAAAQKANIDYKKTRARKAVAAATSAAVAAGASPIPFSDAAILAPIQIGMIAGISSIFGLELSTATLSTLVSSAIGVGGATLAGRSIVVNLIKFIPGGGTLVGGAISAATAGTLTAALGEAYIQVLAEVFSEKTEAQISPMEIGEMLKGAMKKIYN